MKRVGVFLGGSGSAEYCGQRLVFVFHYKREERRGRGRRRGRKWWRGGSCYLLDLVNGALPCAAEHTALKEPFLKSRESHPPSRTPTPFQNTPLPPLVLQTPSSFLSVSPGRTPSASCVSTWAGRRWTPALVLRRHLFSSGIWVCWCWQGESEGWVVGRRGGGRGGVVQQTGRKKGCS